MKPKYLKALLIILACSLAYSLFSVNKSFKRIKELTAEAKANVDSLKVINEQYVSLQTRYEKTYGELNMTRGALKSFKSDLSAMMDQNISSVRNIKNSVRDLIKETDELELLPTDSSAFRFD